MLLTNSLIRAYRFEGNANDWASGQNGTVIGATFGSGVMGGAAIFDGVDDKINIPDTGFIYVGYTMCMWLKILNKGCYIFGHTENSTGGFTYTTNNKFICYTPGGSGTSTAYLADATQWFHLTIIRSSSTTFDFYVNSILIGTQTTPTSQNMRFDNIGNRFIYSYFKGSIDEFMIFNKPLSTENIRRVMLGLHPF